LPEWLYRSSGQAGPENDGWPKIGRAASFAANRPALLLALKGKFMSEFNDWFQNNAVDLARLLVQIAILATLVRYGRKLLATLRASQEQIGALLKLSVSDAVGERLASASEPASQFEPPAVAVHEPEPEPEPVFAGASSRNSYADEREHTLGGRVIGSQAPAFTAPAQRFESPSLTPWVSAPATEPDRVMAQTVSIPARPSASAWLQAPMRSSGVSPWRKMVRWLQAPVRH
jgi:hypothetical protein